MRIKSLVIIAVLATAIFGFSGVPNVHAAVNCMAYSDISSQVSCLQQVIAELVQQLSQLQTQQGTTPTAWCHTFNVYLYAYAKGDGLIQEVAALQTALTKEGFNVSGDSKGTFGDATAAAVVAFQGKYGITQTGTVGPITRAKLNSLYGCATTSTTTQPSITVTPQVISSNGYIALSISPQPTSPWTLTFKCPTNAWVTDGGCNEVETWSQSAGLTQKFQAVNQTNTDQTITAVATINGQITTASFIVQPANAIQPSITITSPNGGETWAPGETHDIIWNSNWLLASDKIDVWLWSYANSSSTPFAETVALLGVI